MKWALQHVKVTLQESDSGETLVIEQRPDGKVSCKSDKPSGEAVDKRKKAEEAEPTKKGAAKSDNPPEKAAKVDKPAGKPAKADKSEDRPGKADKSEDKPTRSEPAKTKDKPEKAQADKPRTRRPKSLEWTPITKRKYDGFAARSGSGHFEALHAKDSQWALFYKHPEADSRHLGCFPNFDKAREAAQAHNDRGVPEPEGITEEKVILLCPMPAETAPEHPSEPANTAPAAPATPASDAQALTPELRAEMMSSLTTAIRTAMEGAA